MIRDAAALAEATTHWAQAEWLAIDTEFLRVDTYYPRLCLIQVADPHGSCCIDALAFEAPGALQPLMALMADPRILKVFHAASQDLELFVQLGDVCPAPLFDTQVAAAALGIGDQLGYAALVERELGIVLDKSLTRTDWSRRPLSAAEIAYALADVDHLATLLPRLREALQVRGRMAWVEEDCARLAQAERYRSPPENAWKRLKGLVRLPPAAQAAAMALAVWREQLAQQRNRPRKWILDDEPLYRLAERRPGNAEQLAALNVLPPRTLQKQGDALLAVLRQAGNAPASMAHDEQPLDAAQKQKLARLAEVARQTADQLQVPVSLLATRADLEALVRHGQAAVCSALSGWRRQAVGEALLAALSL